MKIATYVDPQGAFELQSRIVTAHVADIGFFTRGILIDVAAFKGVTRLDKGYAITMADCQAALKAQGLADASQGDVGLFQMELAAGCSRLTLGRWLWGWVRRFWSQRKLLTQCQVFTEIDYMTRPQEFDYPPSVSLPVMQRGQLNIAIFPAGPHVRRPPHPSDGVAERGLHTSAGRAGRRGDPVHRRGVEALYPVGGRTQAGPLMILSGIHHLLASSERLVPHLI